MRKIKSAPLDLKHVSDLIDTKNITTIIDQIIEILDVIDNGKFVFPTQGSVFVYLNRTQINLKKRNGR